MGACKEYLVGSKDFWVKNLQKSLGKIYATLTKNQKKMPAAVCRFYYKSGFLALKF